MAEAISIIVYTLGNSEDPYYLVERSGAWQDFRSGTLLKAAEKLRAEYDRLLDLVSQVVENNLKNPAGPQTRVPPIMDGLCSSLYKQVFPAALQALLEEKANNSAEPPVLRLHVAPTFDWIPWELMRDPRNYLGLRYQISRVPISLTLPYLDESKPKAVSRVRSLLGREVLDAGLQADWKTTFAPPATVQYTTLPNGAGIWPDQDDVLSAFTDDIVHLTCHGAWDDVEKKYYWALDPDTALGFVGGISDVNFTHLSSTDGRPLVFANACAQLGKVDGVVTGFGRELFVHGAQNTVSAFAKVSKVTAIPFAKTFYRHLLCENKTIGRALFDSKTEFHARGSQDPSYLFYCLYGPGGTRFQYV